MKRIAAIVLFLLLLPASLPARDFTLSVQGTGLVLPAREYDTLSPNDWLGIMNLELGMELPELLPGLSLELGWEYAAQSRDLFAGDSPWLSSDLLLHGITLSASFRLPFLDWLVGTVRLGGTVDFARLKLSDNGGEALSGWATPRVGGVATLGLEVRLPTNLWRDWFGYPEGDPRRGFTMGLRIEAGYCLRGAFHFDQLGAPATSPEKNAIPRLPVDLGDLDLSGPIIRAGLVVTF